MTRSPIILLCGGKGTRLREVTEDKVPKPMVDVFGKPFLHWLLKHYSLQGFTNITLSVGHQAEIITNYPWDYPVNFLHDGPRYFGWDNLKNNTNFSEYWVVNGDTFIPHQLPYVLEPTVLSFRDVDAGAQFVGRGKIQIEPCLGFYDIGTPYGLDRFKEYFKTHPLYLTHLDKK